MDKNMMRKTIVLICTEIVLLVMVVILIAYRLPAGVIMTVLIITLLLAAIVLYQLIQKNKIMLYMVAQMRKKNSNQALWDEEEAEKLRLIKKRVELSALQSQINPHFLYNTLDSIRSRALLDGHGEIASMTEILSKFFRYCISHDENLVKIKEEMNHIYDYYYIQKYRFEDRFDMNIEMENDDLSELYIPRMTLQPIVENAMIHGLEKMNRKGPITVRVIQTDKKVVVIVTDNGAGMNLEQLNKLNQKMQNPYFDAGSRKGNHNGIALTNVNTRLKITFGDEYGIHYRSIEGIGTDAVITIPIIDEFLRIKYDHVLESN